MPGLWSVSQPAVSKQQIGLPAGLCLSAQKELNFSSSQEESIVWQHKLRSTRSLQTPCKWAILSIWVSRCWCSSADFDCPLQLVAHLCCPSPIPLSIPILVIHPHHPSPFPSPVPSAASSNIFYPPPPSSAPPAMPWPLPGCSALSEDVYKLIWIAI